MRVYVCDAKQSGKPAGSAGEMSINLGKKQPKVETTLRITTFNMKKKL